MRRAALALALLPVITAAGDQKAIDKALAGYTAGRPVECIDTSQVNGPEIIDSRNILYRGTGRIWRNTLPDACPSLRDDSLLVVEIYGARMCRDDRFRTVIRGTRIPSGYCRLGDFTPYTKVKPAPAQPK